MDKQQLVLEGGAGKPLLDILCLADFPGIKAGAVNTISVTLAQ